MSYFSGINPKAKATSDTTNIQFTEFSLNYSTKKKKREGYNQENIILLSHMTFDLLLEYFFSAIDTMMASNRGYKFSFPLFKDGLQTP